MTIFILGVNGFPYGSARTEKLKLIGKSLVNENAEVTFICNSWGVFKKGELKCHGSHENISYIYTSKTSHRPSSFIGRRIAKLRGNLSEIYFLLTHKCDSSIVSITSGMFFLLFKYWIVSRIKGFKIYYPHHEEEEVFLNGNPSILKRVNLYFFKRFAFNIIDGAFPISKYLEDHIRHKNPSLPLLRIPPLCDFDYFKHANNGEKNTENYFLYCGSAAYREVMEFIIESFEITNEKDFYLYIVSSGSIKNIKKLKSKIAHSSKSEKIKFFGFLDYNSLINKYIHANALLIPLRETIQDIARFPHKIGEYTASGNPIITTNNGEIPHYFTHLKDAVIAPVYNTAEYAKCMQYIIDNPESSKQIGMNGYSVGMTYFNYQAYGNKILELMNLNSSN